MTPPTHDPLVLFHQWFEEAKAAHLPAPEAMTLATATKSGTPSARIVLLKQADERGFFFYTNYRSRKGSELTKNPKAALVFFWEPLQKQIRIEGKVLRASRAESDAYFASRERGSQIGAWASPQSQPIESREKLLQNADAFERKYEGQAVVRPPHWGGYRVVPERIEFWLGSERRLHDRFLYEKKKKGWKVTRIAP